MKNTCLYCGIELSDYSDDVCRKCVQDIEDEKEMIVAAEEENWRLANNLIVGKWYTERK